jgi:pimeloyl-ACP methyl ester carboxylesterase
MTTWSSSLLTRLALLCALALSLAACGGGGGGGDGVPAEPAVPPPQVQPADPTGPGELKSASLVAEIPASAILEVLNGAGFGSAGFAPRYAVRAYRLEYLTTDADGLPVQASGLVGVPVKAAGAKSPVLGYQHATIFRDAEAPSNNATASELSVVLASLGFVVVAPDYVGYGASKGRAHPYLLSAPSAAAVVDFLTAAATWRRHNGVADNGQLFLTGYSEGGYVTMATHRALQASGSALLTGLRVVVPGGGPYDVQATLDGILDMVRDEVPVLGSLLDPGLLRHLGSSVRRELREELLKHLLPDDADVVLDTRFIDFFLADDVQAIARVSSVHEWKPDAPVRLFHGRDDRTVPYNSASSTLFHMQTRGAGDLVSLTDCTVVPASHLGCVPEYLVFMLRQFAAQAQDL